MLFEYRYFGSSTAASTSTTTGLSFAPDLRRDPTYLRAEITQQLAFRECISALHDVVVSDLRFKPKDRTDYLKWRAAQDDLDWAEVAATRKETKAQLDAAVGELNALRARRNNRWTMFDGAKKKYFDWIYKKNIDAWYVLDPVITVHPDEVAFECFSQDESSYGRFACSHEVFSHLGDVAYGTTNVDYSQSLYDEFQKIRDYKATSLVVDPAGFEVKTASDEAYREVKIDLPDTWVRGFLQVGAAMTLPGATRFRLHPMDVHNFCFQLRRHREKHGPRSLRFLLTPGQPVRVKFEPFDTVISCPRSIYEGPAAEIRVWGRRRLLTLERLVPVCRGFEVVLLGTGMPSFWIADCGDMSYTLGLSGWTANDWSSSGNFDLLASRGEVDSTTAAAVWDAISRTWLATTRELSAAVGRDVGTVESAMVQFAQSGRAMYDLRRGVWRKRELSRTPLDMGTLRFSNEREAKAAALVAKRGVALMATEVGDGTVRLLGRVGKERLSLVLDGDRRLRQGECSCSFYFQNKLRKGPCEHLLAVRLAHERRLGEVLEVAPTPAAPKEVPNAPGKASHLRVVGAQETPRVGPAAEAERLVGLMVNSKIVEIMPHNRPVLVRDLTAILARHSQPELRGRALFSLFERETYIEEFFVADADELIDLFRMWG